MHYSYLALYTCINLVLAILKELFICTTTILLAKQAAEVIN